MTDRMDYTRIIIIHVEMLSDADNWIILYAWVLLIHLLNFYIICCQCYIDDGDDGVAIHINYAWDYSKYNWCCPFLVPFPSIVCNPISFINHINLFIKFNEKLKIFVIVSLCAQTSLGWKVHKRYKHVLKQGFNQVVWYDSNAKITEI